MPSGMRHAQVPHARTCVFVPEVPVPVSQVLLATGPLCAVPVSGATKGKAGKPAAAGQVRASSLLPRPPLALDSLPCRPKLACLHRMP